MGARGLDVAHNVIDISVVRDGENIEDLWDHMEYDHKWKTRTATGSELLMEHFQCHHGESMVASEHMLRDHVEHQCQYRAALESLIKEPEDLIPMKLDELREKLGL